MPPSPQLAMLNRSLELARGTDPDYVPIDSHYVSSIELNSTAKAVHALSDLETAAWARAEYSLVRDVAKLLAGDRAVQERWSDVVVSQDPSLLQTKSQLMAFLAKIVSNTFEPYGDGQNLGRTCG